MRTTIDIPDPLYRRLKAAAAYRGSTVKRIVLELVQQELDGSRPRAGRIQLPLIDSDRPGSLRLTNAKVNEILFP